MSTRFGRLLRASLASASLVGVSLACSTACAAADAAPLALRQAIEAALAGNLQLQGFVFQLRAQQARSRQAALRPAPELSLEVENFAGLDAARGFDSSETTLALSQLVELGGRREARADVATAAYRLIDAERAARQLDVLAEVTRRFIVVAAGQERLRLARSAVTFAEQTVAASERRVKAAKSPHAELDRARIALDRIRLDEHRAAVGLETARRQLAAVWGESQTAIGGQPFGEVQGDLFTLPVAGEFGALIERLAASPDFLRFASEARLREAELRLAATRRRPDLTLTGGIRHIEAEGEQALIAGVAIPLFSGRRSQTEFAEARANRERVDTERRAAEIAAQATLYELHHRLERAIAEAATLRGDILPRAREALAETEHAYARGRYSYLELVDAQREYLALQAGLIDTSADAHLLRAEIERLTNAPLTEHP